MTFGVRNDEVRRAYLTHITPYKLFTRLFFVEKQKLVVHPYKNVQRVFSYLYWEFCTPSPDPGKSRVSPGNYIAKINGVHREVMCWHLLSTTHAGCNTRELIPLWHLLGRLPLASRLAVAHGEVHR